MFPPGLDSYRINTQPLPSTSLQRTSPSISMLQVSSVSLREWRWRALHQIASGQVADASKGEAAVLVSGSSRTPQTARKQEEPASWQLTSLCADVPLPCPCRCWAQEKEGLPWLSSPALAALMAPPINRWPLLVRSPASWCDAPGLCSFPPCQFQVKLNFRFRTPLCSGRALGS